MSVQIQLCITTAVIIWVVVVGVLYLCFILSGRISRAEERRERERKHKPPKETT